MIQKKHYSISDSVHVCVHDVPHTLHRAHTHGHYHCTVCVCCVRAWQCAMCVCVHMCACVHVCVCVHVCACVHVCMCACVCVCMCVCACVCVPPVELLLRLVRDAHLVWCGRVHHVCAGLWCVTGSINGLGVRCTCVRVSYKTCTKQRDRDAT